MGRNNRLFSGRKISKRWDGLGIVMMYLLFAASAFPLVFGCFFLINPHVNFLFSFAQTSIESEWGYESLVFLFLSVEIASAYCFCNSMGSICFVVCSYFVHSTYWMKMEEANSSQSQRQALTISYRKYQILRLHTSRFNAAFSNTLMAPFKEILSAGFVLCSFCLVRYHSHLQFGSIFILGSFDAGCLITIIAIYLPAGWVWKSSVKLKTEICRKDYNSRRKNYLCPFGIMVGSFYVVKGYTFLSLISVLMRYIFRLLVAFKL